MTRGTKNRIEQTAGFVCCFGVFAFLRWGMGPWYPEGMWGSFKLATVGGAIGALIGCSLAWLGIAAWEAVCRSPHLRKVLSLGSIVAVILLVGVLAGIFIGKPADERTHALTSSAGPKLEGRAVAPTSVPRQDSGGLSKALPRLANFGSDTAIPCKMMIPLLDELRNECADRLSVESYDVFRNPGEGTRYGIKLIPTQIFFDATGKELFRHEGFFSKEDILAKWKELGVDLSGSGPQHP